MKLFFRISCLLILCHFAYATDCDANDPNIISCHNGGDCATVNGHKDYGAIGIFSDALLDNAQFLQKTHEDHMYCDCGESSALYGKGYTGLNCRVHYERCPDDSMCFHGAPCIQDFSNEEKYHCACPLTLKPDATFVGESCEYKATSTCYFGGYLDLDKIAYFGNNNGKIGEWFCANNGTCRPEVSYPSEKCECLDGFYGLHCEFKEETKCDLDCENGGLCKNGVKDYTDLSATLQQYFDEDLKHDKHCICPKGFTGRLCEIEIASCGPNHCLNGAGCTRAMKKYDDEYFFCDCLDASKTYYGVELQFAGPSCERESTSFCTPPEGFKATDFFCTNDGICPESSWEPCICGADYSGPRCEFLVENHMECDFECKNGGTCFFGSKSASTNMQCKCPEGYIGDNCETKNEMKVGKSTNEAAHHSSRLLMALSISTLSLFAMLLFLGVYMHRCGKISRKKDSGHKQIEKDEDNELKMDETEDGYVLQTVEII